MADLKPWERNWNGNQQQSLHQDDGKKPWERDWSGNQAQEKPKDDKGFLAGAVDEVRDFGVGAFKGAIGIGDMAVGLADTAASLTGLSDGENNIRNALANRDGLIGFDPQRAKKIADEWYSDDYKKARAEMQELSDRFDNSESFGGKAAALGNMLGHATFVNPSLAINTVVESLPSMFAGGAAGRALKAAGVVKSGAAAAATGEGLVMAGQQAANIQELNGDNSLSQGQALASIGTGVAGGLIGLAGARVAQKLGIDDVDAVLANGVGRQAAAKELRHVPPMSISNMMMRGAIQEGLLEELPQSTMEQIVANLATDKHWSDGVAHAGVMGVLSGGLMGAGMNAARGVQQSEYANLGETEQRWQQDINDREAVLRDYHAALEKAKANFATPEEIAAIEAAFANQVDLSGGTFAQPKVTELSDYLASVSPQADNQVHTSDLADDAKNAPNELQQSANPEKQTATESQFVENEADEVQAPQKPSEQMGLDPNHGVLTDIAANAVDSGISTPAVEPVPEDAGVDFSEAQQYWDNLTANGQKAAVKALGVKGGKAGRFDDAPDAVKKGLASMLVERKSAIDAAKSNHAVGESLPNIPLAIDAAQGYGSEKAAKGLDKLLPNDVQKVFGGLDKSLRDAMLLAADYRADYALRDELGLPSMAHHYPQQVKDALSLVKQRAEADSNVGGLMESLASSVAGYRRNNGWQTPLASNLALQNVPDANKTAAQQEIERIIQPLEADGVASNVVDYAERKMVLLDINGVKVPFYRSTGLGGKEDVEAGKWYPFFGVGKIDGRLGWVTKTGGKGTKNRPDLNMNDYYGSPTLKRYAQMLDSVYDADTLKQMNLKTHAVGKPVLDASGNPIRLPAPDAYSGFANQIELNSFVRTINDAMGEPLNEDDLTGIEQRIDDVVARVEGKSAGVAPEAKAEPAVEPQAETQTMQEVDAVKVATQENAPQLVEVQTAKGVKRVSQADLDNQELPVLPTYTKGGKRSAVRLNRSDIVQAQEQEEVQQGDVVSEAQHQQEVVKAEKVEPKLETLIEREASKQAEAGKSRIGKPAGDKLVGKNKEGIDVFEDAKGVRYYTNNKIRQTEAVRIHPSGESWVDVSRRHDEFKTVEELDKDKEQVNESGLGRISALAEDGGRTLEGVLSEDVSGVQNSGRAEVQAGRSSNDDVSGSGRAGESGVQLSRSVGDDSREVHSSTTRIRSDGRVGEGRLDNQVEQDGEITEGIQDKPTPEQAVVAEDVAPNFPLEADFVITQDDAIGQGGLKTKFKQNLAAIETLKKLQAEDRAATKDEQKVLAKWVGWGGLSAAFRRADGSVAQGWAKEVEQLEAILSADELQAARESTIAAHYTAPEIVTAMWQAVERMGFKGGRVLEPSVGSGNFIGLLPKSLRKVTAIYGTELDSITGGLAQKLYPTANIKVMGFQDYAVPDGHFKLAIGNPPFGAIKITDLDRKHLSGLSLHNYFFAKSVDALEDNGVLAMVVTNRFMDASEKNDRARAYIAERTELLGAVRLPNNAFKANANTEVTTDIVFLRKLTQAERGNAVGFQWNETKLYTDKDGNQVPLNVYFHAHPEMMLGEFGAFGSMYSGQNEAALVAKDGQDTVALLNQALESLPQNFMTQPQKDEAAIVKAMVADIPDVKVGSMFVRNGQVFEREPDLLGERQARPVEYANAKAQERVVGLIGIRDLLAQVRKMQLSESTPEALLESARKKLNDAYDQFIKEHGFIHADANKRLFRDDPSYPQLASLEENYDKGVSVAVAKNTGEKPRKPSAKKADILSRRTQFPFVEVNQVSSAKDGLVESLARFGRLDLARIAALYGKSEQDVISELGDLVYQDPTYGWQTADEYLSGDVKAKLAQAKEAAQQDRAFERNVKALEAVQPTDIEAVDIEIRAGSHWIPAAYVDAFLREVMGAPEKLGESVFNAIGNEWVLPKLSPSANARAEFATDYKSVGDVVSAAFNGKQLAVYDRHDDDTRTLNQAETDAANQKVEAVKRAWADWVWQDDARRDALARLYNDIFNTNVQQRYDGSHLKLLGKVDDSVISLRPTQKNAVWRITQKNFTLLDHVVGAGKTFTMVAAAMELRRMGLASKPMIVVPNHLVGQWGKEFLQLYPNANILVASKKDFEANTRKKLVARIANGDWDAVIVAHSSFGKIAVDKEFEAEFIQQQIDEIQLAIEAARKQHGQRSLSVKDMEKRQLSLKEKYKKLTTMQTKDHDNLAWGELGIDALFVDEAHEFKNLAFTSTMQRVAGLGNQTGSQKAMDLYMKIQQLKQNPLARVVFATGTPISNSMAEMFTMQRYLDGERLRQQGVNHFDAWAKTFGEVVTDWELSASGKYQMKSRFAKFVNMPELMQSYLGFADVINRQDINDALKEQGKVLPVPKIKGGAPQNVVVSRSDYQADYIGVPFEDENGNEQYPVHSLIYRAEHLPKGEDAKKKGADNMLKIVGEARKVALDPRIIDKNAPDFESSKVNVAARKIVEIYHKWDKDKGTQLVFSDLSTPKGAVAKEKAILDDLLAKADMGDDAAAAQLAKYSPDELDAILNAGNFSVYDDLKAKLVAAGIPESEIAFIHDANTELQKDELFGKVRSGRVRVLIGSTSKMGAGTNVQTRLVALHHLDAPWRPSDLEQREGRIIRQGNELYNKDPNGFEVEILRYATEQTMDAMQWQIIENKARFIEQVRKGDTSSRVIEDIDGEAANAAQMKAASSGNPLVLEEMALRKKLNDMEAEKIRHSREQYRVRDAIRTTKERVEAWKNRINALEVLASAKVPEQFDMTVGKKRFVHGQEAARAEAGKALLAQVHKVMGSYGTTNRNYVGLFGDFEMFLSPVPNSFDSVQLNLVYQNQVTSFTVERDASASGLVTRIYNAVSRLPNELEDAKKSLARDEASIPKMEKQVGEWSKGDELSGLRRQHDELLNKLKPKQVNQSKEEGDVSLSMGDSPIDALMWRVNRIYDAIAEVIPPEHMARISVVTREQAKRLLPKQYHPHVGRVRAWYDAQDDKVFVVAENQRSKLLTQFTAWHELGHAKVNVAGRNEWNRVLRDAYRSDAMFRKLTNQIMAERADTADKAGRNVVAASEEALVELYAAYKTGEYGVLNQKYGDLRSFVQRVFAALRQVLVKVLGKRFGRLSDYDLADALKNTIQDNQKLARMMDALDKVELANARKNDDFRLSLDENPHSDDEANNDIRFSMDDIDYSADLDDFYDPDEKMQARLERAKAMGFDTNRVFRHGSFEKRIERIKSRFTTFDGLFALGDGIPAQGAGGSIHKYLAKTIFEHRDFNDAIWEDNLAKYKQVIAAETGENLDNYDDDVQEQLLDLITEYSFVNDLSEFEDGELTTPEWLRSFVGYSDAADASWELQRLRGKVALAYGADAVAMYDEYGTSYLLLPTNGVRNLYADFDPNKANESGLFFSLDDTNAQGGLNQPDKVNQSMGQAIRSVFKLGKMKEYLGDKWTDGLKVSLQALGRRQLMEIYGKLLPMAEYGRLVDRYSADSHKAAADADKLVNEWGKLKDADELADLMHEATLAQVDADPKVSDSALSNKQKLKRNHLNKRFNALSPEAQEIYRQARDSYKHHFEQIKVAMAERMERLGIKRDVFDAMEQRFNDGLKGVYFPLARFGQYVVVVKNKDTGATLSVSRAETMGEARALREHYLEQFPDAKVSQVMLAKEYAQSRDAVGRGFMQELFDELGRLNLSVPQFAEIEDTLNQLYLNSLPDLSWAKHGIHRKGTAGYSNDARRAYAQNMFHGASYLAKLRYSDLMQTQLEHMQEYADGKRNDKEFNQPVAQRVIDEMVKRHDAMINPNSNPLATALTSFGFLWYLGLSPASALVNMSQTPLVALPVMAAKWGATKSSKALLEASKQTVFGKNDITHSLNDDEKVAFERAVNDGTIDVSQSHDLAGIAQGEDAGVLWKMRRVMRVASFMFHQAERFNRQVTFVASYRLAKAAGASSDVAFEQAKDATYRSHFDYSREARPRFMQGNVAKVVFLFKQYSQNMIYTIARNFYLAMKGDKEARKVFAGIMVAHAMAAGVLGLPMVTTLLAIASALGGDDDEPFDAQTALRNSLADVFGDKTSEVMMRGLSRLTPFDVSGRVSLDKLIFPDVQEGLDGKRWAESMASGLLGPVAGLPLSWANGANQIGNGEWAKGLESMLPVSVRNPLKAFRLANEGHIDKSGIVIKDDFDFAEITGQVAGFSPSDLRLAMEGKGAVYNADRRLTRRRSELLSAAAKASMDGDMDEFKRVRLEIAEFSRKNPTRRITNQHILQSVKNRKRRIAGAENGVYLPDSRQDARDAGRFAFD